MARCEQRYFDSGNRLSQDACATITRDHENQSIIDYNTTHYFEQKGCPPLMDERILCQPNLRYKMGYGTPPSCEVDREAPIRYLNIRGPERTQLIARNFQAVPNLGKGVLSADTESMLLNGMDTSSLRQCDRIMEREFDVRTPYVSEVKACVNGALTSIPAFAFRAGQDSRKVFREYLKTCNQGQTRH